MKKILEAKHEKLWNNDEFAIFIKYFSNNDSLSHVDIVLTAKDSKYDEFYKIRDMLMNNPDILEEYNNLKKSFEGKTYDKYRIAKREFFGENGTGKYNSK